MSIFVDNIEKLTLENQNYRKVINTSAFSQLVLMSIKSGEGINKEIHDINDQFIRIERGSAKIIINNQEYIAQDVQWVIEVTPEGAAEFVGHGRMCEGTRAHSKNDEAVTLTIKDKSAPIKLVAGYAAGHEAVILTKPMHIPHNKPTENGTTKEL